MNYSLFLETVFIFVQLIQIKLKNIVLEELKHIHLHNKFLFINRFKKLKSSFSSKNRK